MEPDNVERYDRQIRLWGKHGQSKCSSSRICLINADSLGTEILKGLCLAGIGSFVILDSHKLVVEDFGSNLLPHSYLGRNRGEAAKSILFEINDSVSGEVLPLEVYLPQVTPPRSDSDSEHETKFWKQFSCVVASGFLSLDQITFVSRICWANRVPLILCKSVGFYGMMHCQYKEHLVIETHPDNTPFDFSLDRPFTDLESYFNSIDLDNEDQLDGISKFPFIVIIYKHLRKWQANLDHSADYLPTTFAEKREIKSMIEADLKDKTKKRAVRNSDQDATSAEMPFENYIEASKAVFTCLSVSSKIPEHLQAIFDSPKMSDAHSTSNFWLIMKALKEFTLNKNEGKLPVSGLIPDMISNSEEYVKLQNVYAKKARDDVDDVFGLTQRNLGSSNQPPVNSLYDETRLICLNIRDLRLVDSQPIYDSYEFKTIHLCDEQEEEDEFVTIYLGLKALDSFFSTYGRVPGHQDDQVETDVIKLKECARQLLGKVFNKFKNLDQCIYELCRYGGLELHATSAFLAGCVTQEVIKLITNQYLPVNYALVYNAVTASTRTFKMSDIFVKS